MHEKRLILGVDPGTIRTGYCLMWDDGALVECGVLRRPGKLNAWEQMAAVFHRLVKMARENEPDVMAAEEPYPVSLHKNAETDRKIITAFGAPFYAAALLDIEFVSVHPMQVRHSGFHKRALDDVARFLGRDSLKKSEADMADAIGVAAHVAGLTFDAWAAKKWEALVCGS